MKKNIFLSLLCVFVLSSCVSQRPLPIHAVSTEKNFSVIVLPDTQNEVQNFPKIFMSQIDWILGNTEKLNIKAVVHVGDQVNVASDEKQWKTFDEGIKKLDEKNMPVLLALGNHDHPSTLYDKYFPISRYNQRPWWGGQMGKDTDNKYILLTLAGEKYIFISLDFCPTKEEIKWGNETLARYPDHKALLSTHAFLDKDAGRKPHVCTDTGYIWNDFVKLHKNLQLVVSGHVHAENMRTDKNLAGNDVHQMLADFQEEDYGGNGWLRILQFSPKNNRISVTTYSPSLNKFQEDTNSQFQLEYNF
ncbi:MAG: metallophosphoesterase [Candidatus Gracilibacteria bacterium]